MGCSCRMWVMERSSSRGRTGSTERLQAHSDDASSRFWRRRTARSPLYDQPIWIVGVVRESRGGAVPGVR
jgi:hypothetical protein